MTAAPDEQPLTRRQVRENERAGKPAPAAPQAPSEADRAMAEQAAAERAAWEHAAEERAIAERKAAERAAWAPQSAQPVAVDPTLGVASEDLQGVPERTLTRRELRDLLAAQSGGVLPDDDGEFDMVERAILESDAALPPVSAPQPPAGHWSLDIDVEDDADDHGLDQVLSRGVGAGGVPTTTNALILPMIPQQPGSSGVPLTTGEMMVTGSISLPSLGDTGAHPNRIDSSEVDRLLDQVDDSAPSTSAQPIRASRAVSTHTSTRDTLTPPKQGGLNMPTVLAITAAVLALGVVGLIFGGYLFKIF